MSVKLKAHLAVLTANLIFGVNFSVVKYITPGLMKPFGLNVVRVLVTTSLLWLMHLWERPSQPLERKDVPRLIACGLLGIGFNQLLFIKGLSLTYSIHASLLMLCTPLLITLMAFIFLRERMSPGVGIGLLMGVTGSVMLITSKESIRAGRDIITGDILIALNAISYAFYFVLVKPLMKKYSPLQVLRWSFTFGGLFILPFGWTEFLHAPWNSFSSVDLAAIAFVVLGATFLAYLFNIYGLHHIQATATGAYIYLQPIFATIVAVVFLEEKLSLIKFISALMIFVGVYLVQQAKLRPT